MMYKFTVLYLQGFYNADEDYQNKNYDMVFVMFELCLARIQMPT